MPERIDLYTADLQPTGRTVLRGDKVPEGFLRIVAGFIVYRSDGDVLLTLRDSSKHECPDMYEMTGSGGVRAGETALEGCLREMREETGLTPDEPPRLIYTDQRNDMRATFFTYLCRYDGPRDAVCLQPGETVAYRWASPAEVRRIYNETPQRIYLSPGDLQYLQSDTKA